MHRSFQENPETSAPPRYATRLPPPKKFSLLEYFYILLSSTSRSNSREQVFESFKQLKHKFRLGESKYKKLTADPHALTVEQLHRYNYTFERVIEEAKEYDLLTDELDTLRLTKRGQTLLEQHGENPIAFNRSIGVLIESKHGAFRNLVEFLYSVNKYKPGLLVLPSYSPGQLSFIRSDLQTTDDIIRYSQALQNKLEQDLQTHLGLNMNLTDSNAIIIRRLIQNGLLPTGRDQHFEAHRYHVIVKRFRDYWINYFLREIYYSEFYLSLLEVWVYRAKQVGILHATEFYPYFSGKIVYATSVVLSRTRSRDFLSLYSYDDGMELLIHEPSWESIQESFVKSIVEAYFDLRKTYRTYFINLSALKEIVCYNLKIPEPVFQECLQRAYHLSLSGELRVKISLEVDKLPEETNAIYLKEEPVLVEGRYRNIIAIEVAHSEAAVE